MTRQDDLFRPLDAPLPAGVYWLRAQTSLDALLPQIEALVAQSPWRHWQVPGGGVMSVESTNAGAVGWCSDLKGYRYEHHDPMTGAAWPPMPAAFQTLARECAARAGFRDFAPDCCLVNRYAPGARMGTHRDADEIDFSQPIVSVSLGLSATFVWLGAERAGRGVPIEVSDGDVVVFGGDARRGYHRVKPVRGDTSRHGYRINLTFRKAR
jgi:alkylated DNA repair protein (DNA oxidative demethylase)